VKEDERAFGFGQDPQVRLLPRAARWPRMVTREEFETMERARKETKCVLCEAGIPLRRAMA